jgi:phosphoribosyl 1,2-cyclic phosphodiesterase
VKLDILGARGSTPATGAAFARYGGATSCVAVSHHEGPPVLLLDAGTGIRGIGALLDGRAFTGTLLFGHLHWDHTQGLPFARALDREDARVDALLPGQGDGVTALEVLSRGMSPPHFPITPDDLGGTWSFDFLDEGEHHIEGFRVQAREIPHKGGRTFGYRIDDGRSSIAYLSDHGPLALGPGPQGWGDYHDAALALAGGVDLLLHDAQYTADELPPVAHFGHSAGEYAVALGEKAGVGRIVLFHHDPSRTDDELDAIMARFDASAIPVEAAVEGATYRV